MNDINVLIKGTPESSLLPFPLHQGKIQGEANGLQPGRGSSPEPNYADILILDLQSLKV